MTEEIRSKPRSIRWAPAIRIVLVGVLAIVWVRFQSDWAFQKRNLITCEVIVAIMLGLLLWWWFLSRASLRAKAYGLLGLVALALIGGVLFRIRGMSGDMVPIVEFRWRTASELPAIAPTPPTLEQSTNTMYGDFPQFLGPSRDGVLAGPPLEANWIAHPPEILWRHSVGAAWSGFSIVGDVCYTQEQRAENDCVVAYELQSGKEIWVHSDPGRYDTVIAGEGPRATPTIVNNHVYACGGMGILNCLDATTGKLIWARDLITESASEIPQWGYACSPLVIEDRVVVHGGEGPMRSLLAFRAGDGDLIWSAGTHGPSYASPSLATLAGVSQVLAFNDGTVSGHDPETGGMLWEKPWGNGNVVCAVPVVVSSNRVLFSSGYGVGSLLFEITNSASHNLEATLVWKSIRMKSKFAHLFTKNECLFGLDDGILACVNLSDGSQRWKEGRYGHGQGLLVGEFYLLMAEAGELVLLRPTPDAPNELARFRVFNAKTWNPIALSGNLLLVRNDREAACLRLPLNHPD